MPWRRAAVCCIAAMNAPYDEPTPRFVPYAERPAMNAPIMSSQIPPMAIVRARGFAAAL